MCENKKAAYSFKTTRKKIFRFVFGTVYPRRAAIFRLSCLFFADILTIFRRRKRKNVYLNENSFRKFSAKLLIDVIIIWEIDL